MEAKLPSSGEEANWIHIGDLTGVGAEGCISIVGHIDDLRGRLRGQPPSGACRWECQRRLGRVDREDIGATHRCLVMSSCAW